MSSQVNTNPAHPTKPKTLQNEQQAIHLLSLGFTQADVSRELGVNRNTVHKWTRDPDFSRRYEQTQKNLHAFVTQQAHSVYAKAVDKLGQWIDSDKPGVSLKAIGLITSLCHARASISLEHEKVEHLSDAEARAELERLNRELASPTPDQGTGGEGGRDAQ